MPDDKIFGVLEDEEIKIDIPKEEPKIVKKTTTKPKRGRPKRDKKEVYVDDLEYIYNEIESITSVAGDCISIGNVTGLDESIKGLLREYKKRLL